MFVCLFVHSSVDAIEIVRILRGMIFNRSEYPFAMQRMNERAAKVIITREFKWMKLENFLYTNGNRHARAQRDKSDGNSCTENKIQSNLNKFIPHCHGHSPFSITFNKNK